VKWLIIFATLAAGLLAQAAYIPPIGIPAPPFGINEQPVFPTPWTGTVTGAYYIDKLHAAATDTSNLYGYPAKPRLTIPNGDSKLFEAGAVIVVTNGPYSPSSSVFHLNFNAGTNTAPIFFVGYGTNGASGNKAWILNRELQVKGSYFIIEGFYVQGTTNRAKIRPITGFLPDHWSVRKCEVTDPLANSGNALSMGGSYSVGYSNYCHHNGDYTLNTSSDVHSALAGNGSHHVWFLDNEFCFSQGDSVQINSGLTPTDLASFIYIGRNKMHSNKENAIDIKSCEDVIISGNDMYNFQRIIGLGGSGEPMALNDENQPWTGDHRIWVILNRIRDCESNAIRHQAGCNTYGNLIYNVGTTAPAGHALVSYGAFQDRFENNTVINQHNGGIYVFGGSAGTRHEFRNNLFANVETNDFTLRMENIGLTNSVVANCLWPIDPLRFLWGATTYTNVSSIQAAQGAYWSGNFSAAPGVVSTNAASVDATLVAGSAAIDAGVTPTIPAAFFALYGLNIAVDINGTPRPQGAAWDIGAFEFTGSGSSPVSATPPQTFQRTINP